MITWQIARAPLTTRATVEVESTVYSRTETTSDSDDDVTVTGYESEFSTSIIYSYTSLGSNGQSTLYSTSYSSNYTYQLGRTYGSNVNPEQQEPTFEEDVINTSEGDATLSSNGFATYSQTTSTTATVQSFSTSLGTVEGTTLGFTTTFDEEDTTKRVLTELNFDNGGLPTTFWTAAQVGFESTVDSTTTIASTYSAATHATVAQAVTSDALKAEVIYSLAAPEEWAGYTPATANAQSATRLTFEPSVSTQEIAVTGGISLPTTTASLIIEAIVTQVQWSQSVEEAFEATTVDFEQLPNATGVTNSTRAVTQANGNNFTVRPAQTLTYGNVDLTTSWIATSQIKSHGTYGAVVQRFHKNVEYQTTIPSTMTYFQTVTTPVFLTADGQGQSVTNTALGTPTPIITRGVTSRTFQLTSVEGQTTVFGPLQVNTTREALGRSRYFTSGAVIGDAVGGWFTANNGTIYTSDTKYRGYTVLDGAGPRGFTMQPKTEDFITIHSNSVTWVSTTEIAGETVSSSSTMIVGVDGSPKLIQDPFGGAAPFHFGAVGTVERGAVIVEQAGPGAYKDIAANEGTMIIGPNGVTTSFSGDASIITEGEVSQNIHSWQPIVALSPPIQRTNRSALTWTEFRNTTAIPPIPL